ncbi:hypothetical protein J437_LFUL002802 [Ladona fulva]|uniref:Uncharacterized protein n=1 Tax=Ladona fulva TaxID=123851 RepID=A0A8K0K5K3_LADFU|nr:hypothetical protein J437_LFUL002802 [Ladona fulva]
MAQVYSCIGEDAGSFGVIRCVDRLLDLYLHVANHISLDISQTLLDFLNFIGFNTAGMEHFQQLTQPQIFTTVPAIVMTVVCARGILLWLFNLILLLTTILALKNNLENYKVKKNKQKEGEWRDVSKLWLTEPPPRKDSTESIPPNGAAPNPWHMRAQNVPPTARMYDNDRNANMNQMDRTFHDFLSRGEDEGRSSFRENGPPPAELRNELPWSYFSHRDDLKGPPKRNKNVLEPMPPVPPPDYTLKFPQYTRPVINRNSDNRSSWSSKDGSNLPTLEPFIPAPDYERRRLPPRMIGRQTSQESTNSQPSQPRYGTRQQPHIPQPDYDNRRAPLNAMKPTMKQELLQMVAARGRTNPAYISTEDDGYREPHVQTPDYAKPRKVKQRVDDLQHRPKDDFQRGNSPHIISGGHNPNNVTGRARHYGYF